MEVAVRVLGYEQGLLDTQSVYSHIELESEWHLSYHSIVRFRERCMDIPDHLAAPMMHSLLYTAAQVPNRLASELWVRQRGPKEVDSLLRRTGHRYYACGMHVFITSASTVVTYLRATEEDAATLLTWRMIGIWPK